MDKLTAIRESKTFRQDLDAILQRMKAHRTELLPPHEAGMADDAGEVIAQHILSIRDLEVAIMRQGMVLKSIGGPTPYPESKNPASSQVEPPADGLKM